MKRLVSLVLAFIFVIQTVLAVQCPHEDNTLKKWSDPITWTGLTAPATNAEVTIPSGLHVLMDDPNPPTLRGITIANGGSLTWDLKPIQLNVSHIMVQGLLQIGSEECPFDEKTVITLEDEQISVDTRVGMKVIGVLEGGSLIFHGKVHSPVWTRLDGTATKGSKSITLRDAVTWQANDTIVLAPTNYDPEEAETVEIESVSQDGKTVTLKSALQYDHFGLAPASNSGFEERAEVGVLDRYIKVQGNEASEKDGFGGHTMCIANYTMANFVGVEFTRMGQRGVLARYPVHYHVVEFGRFLVNDNSFHYNYQRCVTLHSSSNLHVINNLCYDVEGHAMFIEDGFDTGALLKDNLIIKVRAGTLQPHDVYASSGFFLTGPNNTIIGNQVSGAAGNGYWYSAPVELIGPSHTTYAMAHPYRTQLGIFENNNARTIQQNGLFVDLGADMNNNPVVQGYDPRVDAMNNASEPVLATFNTFQATKCQMYGAHTRGGYHAIVDAKIASSFGGVRFANAPFSTARQTMTRGLIQRVTQNSPTSVPNSSGALAGLPQRGIVPYGGPNKFQQVSLKGFNLPAGACIGPHGREPLSAGNLISGIDCAGQSLFYVSADAKQTDNEKMFATVYVADSKESQLVVKNDFMTLPSSKCKSHDQNTLLCTSGSIGSVNIYDDDVANTKIPAPLKPDDVHATIYRLNSNLKTIKSEIDIVGYSDPDKKTQKKTVYPLNVPITETDAYGVVFTHQTPAKLRIAIDHVASSSFTTIGLCYPAGSVIQSVKLADGTPLTAADSDTQLKGNKGSMYLMDSVEGRLVLPVVSKSNSAPTEYIITAQVGSTDAVDCFRSLSNDSSHLKVNVTILAAIFTVIAVIIQHL